MRRKKRRERETEHGRTVRVHTSDVSERMRPSQSEVRREYKSRRVIYPSVCGCGRMRPLHVCTRERETVAGRIDTAAPPLDRSDLLALVPSRRSTAAPPLRRSSSSSSFLAVHRHLHHRHYREHNSHPSSSLSLGLASGTRIKSGCSSRARRARVSPKRTLINNRASAIRGDLSVYAREIVSEKLTRER